MEKKNNGIVIILMGVIIVILAVLCILFATNTITFNHKEQDTYKNPHPEDTSVKEDKETKEVSNNISIIFSEEKECENGCQKKVSTTSGEKILYVSQSEVKLGDKVVYKAAEGPISLLQVSVYNDVMIFFETESLISKMYIYDLDGTEVKTISRFIDKDGNQYQIYPSYSQNEIFNISDDGTISFAGTKHIQGGLSSSYINYLGETIDLCESGNEYKDNDIVSAIFKMKYLGNYKFDDISYVSTKTTITDIRNCQ